MPSSGMLRRVALVRTDVSEELNASVIRVTASSMRRLLVTANVRSSPILVTLMMEVLLCSETSVLTRATRRNTQKTAFFEIYVLSLTVKNRRGMKCGSETGRHGALTGPR
jgi:hypothetical protein